MNACELQDYLCRYAGCDSQLTGAVIIMLAMKLSSFWICGKILRLIPLCKHNTKKLRERLEVTIYKGVTCRVTLMGTVLAH